MSRAASKPKTLVGSREAKQAAAVVLEVLSGLRGPSQAAETLGTSLNRYYELETRALQGLLVALEPRPRGRRRTPQDEVRDLTKDKARLERELGRAQALVRAAQRTIGLSPPPSPGSPKGRGKRGGAKSRRVHRGKKALARLHRPGDDGEPQALESADATAAGSEATP
jgi:hypothetical protein